MCKPKYRFIGRDGNKYIWQAPMANSSHVDQITCNVDWFWSRV